MVANWNRLCYNFIRGLYLPGKREGRLLGKEGEQQTRDKLWNLNFFLAWQGTLVSVFGDMIYELALGFWVLAVTGSTAIMGALMAFSVLPRVLVSPFAGVLVDRLDRKWIMVLTDLVRGLVIVWVGWMAIQGTAEVWMVFGAALILGLCAAFFLPATASMLPDIVAKKRLQQANSAFSMVRSASTIAGHSLGGMLYSVLGAPLMFLINGISFLFSGATELFLKIPKVKQAKARLHFLWDLREGLKFVWQVKGLRALIFTGGVLNFFAVMAIVLFLPLFQRFESLGATKYGIFMGFFSVGSFAGFVMMGVVKFKDRQRFWLMLSNLFLLCGALALSVVFSLFPLMLALVFIGGFSNAVVNNLFQTTLQLKTPQQMRGKVFGIIGTVLGSLMPLSMALAGVLAEFIPIRLLIVAAMLLTAVVSLPLAFNREFKAFMDDNV